MILNIFSHLIMSRMFLSSSFVLLFLLCLSLECNGRHILDKHSMNSKGKLPSHSSIKGFRIDPFTVADDLNLKMTEKDKHRLNVDSDHKQADCESKSKEMIKDQKAKKVKEELLQRHHHEHYDHPKLVTYRVPPKNKRVHQQPGFNLDYSPPKTHPPSHN